MREIKSTHFFCENMCGRCTLYRGKFFLALLKHFGDSFVIPKDEVLRGIDLEVERNQDLDAWKGEVQDALESREDRAPLVTNFPWDLPHAPVERVIPKDEALRGIDLEVERNQDLDALKGEVQEDALKSKEDIAPLVPNSPRDLPHAPVENDNRAPIVVIEGRSNSKS